MNTAAERVDEALGKIERAGAGVCALGNLLAIVAPGWIGENTTSGIGYLLEAIGNQIADDAIAARGAVYGRTASANPPGETAQL